MSKKSTQEPSEEKKAVEPKERPKCFVIMPISDCDGYDQGHFDRVYEEMIKPAVIEAGFLPVRADDVKQTHIIILEILKSIVDYDMAICDMSSLNPNVMYELGIRQMNKKPVVLIKDEKTRRIFDTGLMSDIEYSSSLRIDKIKLAIKSIAQSLKNTYENFDEKANSLIDLLGVDVQVQKKTVEVTDGEKLILDKLAKLELIYTEDANPKSKNEDLVFLKSYLSGTNRIKSLKLTDPMGNRISVGDIVSNILSMFPNRRLENTTYHLIIGISSSAIIGYNLSDKSTSNIPLLFNENRIAYNKVNYEDIKDFLSDEESKRLFEIRKAYNL